MCYTDSQSSSGMAMMTPKHRRLNNLQPMTDSPQHTGPSQPKRKRGRPCNDYPATQTPTVGDIREAASFYEGEGTVNNDKQLTVDICQNNREKLDWLQLRFGGKVYGPYTNKLSGNDYYHWILVRERALGFMFTIFTFLSKSRREQFKTGKREFQKTISDLGISEAFLNRKLKSQLKDKRVKGSMRLFGVRK